MKKKLSFFLALIMVFTAINVPVFAADDVVEATESAAVTLSDMQTAQVIDTEGAVVNLDNLTINAEEGQSALSVTAKNVTLNVIGDVALTGGKGGAGIYVAEGASVTIQGTGTLTAIGNAGADDASNGAAGIGGTYTNGNSGAITISGATVIAKGYGVHGSGIGSGSGKVVGEIKIVNGANVTAYGGYYADGVGATLQSSYGKNDPEGGAAIGGGGKTASTVAPITITDSTVVAYGGSKAAGIGANFWCSCEAINITDSNVTAYGGSSSAAIGTSRAGDTGVGSTITITDSTVNATGGAYGAGIGAGYNADSLGNGADESALPETSITISGGNITATGGEGSAAIGGGYKSDNIAVTISDDAVVTATAGALVSGKTVEAGGAASAIGAGANGSGVFENTPAAEIADTAQITVVAHEGGKEAVAGTTNEELAASENVTLVYGGLINTYEELAAALAKDGANVVLGANITCTGEINGTNANINLNGYTLTMTVGGTNFYGTSTIKNGTIDVTGCVAAGDCIIGIGDYSNDATLNLNNVNITGDGYSSAYAVLYVYNAGTLNINGGSIVVSNDSSAAGGVIKAHSAANGKINITDATLTFTDAGIGILDGTVVMDNVDLDINGGKNAINGSALTVKNSTLTIKDCDGRALTLNQGNVVLENSTLEFSGATEGEIRFKKGLTLSADATSNIVECDVWTDADGANVNGVAVTGTETEQAVVTVVNGAATITKPVTGLSGSGTEEDPYLINNLEELKWFRDDVDTQRADGTSQYAGKYIKLNADIDLAGINWNPIGSMTGDHNSFKGIFDGGNHTISNLYVETSGNGLGLFARTSDDAVIKNLTIHNATLISTNNSNYLGAVVANSYASTKIENVHVTGELNISGRGYIGGISGHGYVVMDNVSVKAKGTISSTFWCAGGILGYAGEGTTNITNATVEGVGNGLTITSAAGGLGAIVGMAEDNNGTQPISGANLTAKNVAIKTYVGDYGTAYADYALGYLYGGNETSILTGELVVDGVTVETSTGVTPTIVDAVATVGSTVYFDFKTAVAAAQAGDTITLLKKDISDVGTVSLKAGVTLDGNGKTISGNSSVYMADGNVTVKNVNFKGIHNDAGKLSAIYATSLTDAANVTITGCTFENIDWDAIQLTSKNDADPTVTITNNIFYDDTDTTVQQKRHLHIELGNSTRSSINLTLTGNKFYGESVMAIGAWYINPEGSDITIERNYVQNPDKISVTYNTAETGSYDVSEVVLPLWNEDLSEEIGLAAKVHSATDAYVSNFYATAAEAIAAANAGDVVTLLTEVTGDVAINKAIVFDGNGKTITGKLSVTAEGFTVKNVNVNNANERALYVSGNGTFENCKFTGVHGTRYCYANNGNVVFTNCVLSGTTYGVHFDGGNGEGKVVLNGCEITGWTSFGSAIEGVEIKNTTFYEGNYNRLRLYQNVTLENCTFHPDMTIDFGKNEVKADFTNCSVTDGSALTDIIYLADIVDMGVVVTINGVVLSVAASVTDSEGNITYYATLADAIAAAAEGATVTILANGTYKLPSFDKNITIKAAEGVTAEFDMSSAVKITAATFENVTFNYATTSTYKGIQHSSDLAYNNCIFKGQVFLYAANETFTNCTFTTTDAANYNVWTYGAKNATFTGCTFNSAGKSVLIYNEGAGATDATFTNCKFIASQPVEGKAAIEIDTTLMPDGTDIVINNSTATGFAIGSVSGNSLWNDKKDQTDLTITVDGEKVWPLVPAGDVTYSIYGIGTSGEDEKYRENFMIDIYNVYAKESLVVKLYAADETLLATTSLRETDRDDETVAIARPIKGSKTANVVVAGRLAGSWDTEWHVAPSLDYIPAIIEVYADGILTDTYSPAMDADDMKAYAELDGVAKPALPTATVSELENDDLTFALNFKADKASDVQLAYYGSWYADFVLTINKDVTFNANGGANGYLSGQYDAWSENWVNVPFEDVTMKAGESLKIMEYAATLMGQSGLKLTYNDVYTSVKDFNCGVYFTPEFLAANPDLEVTLELRMYNPANETESYAIGKTYSFKQEFVASVTDSEGNVTEYVSLAAAIAAAQADDTVKLLADVTEDVTINKDVTIDLNGKTLNGAVLPSTGKIAIANGSIVNTNKANSGIEITEGELTLTNVNIDSARHAVRIDGAVTAVIDGGEYKVGTGEGTGTYHAVNVSGEANVTIKSGTFVGPKGTVADSGSAVNVQAGATVSIEGGNFSKGKNNTLTAKGTLAVSGGVFDQAVAEAYCAAGYVPVANEDGTYSVKQLSADMTYSIYGFGTSGEGEKYRENFMIDLYNVYATESLSVELYSGDTLVATSSLRETDRDDETAAIARPIVGSKTVNVVVAGRLAGSWDTVWKVAPSVAYMIDTVKVYADGILVDTYTPAMDDVDQAEYAALPGVAKAASVTDSEGNVTYYTTLKEAFANAPLSATVTLLSDVTVDEMIQIKQHVVFDGNGHTITGTSTKTFEVYSSARIENVTINNTAANGRCVDTRVDGINVKLTNVNLNTTGAGNTQPITVGGNETENAVNMVLTNVKVDAGAAGYGIITFAPNNISIIDSDISGYAALYMKEGSAGSDITVTRSVLTGINEHAGVSNTFATVVFEEDDIHFSTDTSSEIKATALNTATQAAVCFGEYAVSAKISATMTATGDNAVLINAFKYHDDKEVIIGNNSLAAVKAEGYILDGKRLLGKPSLDVAVVDGKINVTAICEEAGTVIVATYTTGKGNKVIDYEEIAVSAGLNVIPATITADSASVDVVKAFLWQEFKDVDNDEAFAKPVCEAAEVKLN